MGRLVVVLQWLLILGSLTLITKVEGSLNNFSQRGNCKESCGSISIEYPFGIRNECFHFGFNLFCITNQTTNFTPTLFLGDGTTKVKQIDVEQGILYIDSPIITVDENKESINNTLLFDLKNLPYYFNLYFIDSLGYNSLISRNSVYLVGCSAIANLVDLKANNTRLDNCVTTCSANDPTILQKSFVNASCGIGLDGVNTTSLGIQLVRLKEKELNLVNTSRINAFIQSDYVADEENIQDLITKGNITATLAWYINDGHPNCEEAEQNSATYLCGSNSDCYNTTYDGSTNVGYICQCSSGYHGNPYLPKGCNDISNFSRSPNGECERYCGKIYIPFPFGLKKGCYRDESFHLNCNKTKFLSFEDGSEKIVNISLEERRLEIEGQNSDGNSIDKNDLFTYTEYGYKYFYKWVIAYQNCNDAKATNTTTYACISKNSECVDVNENSNGDPIYAYHCKCLGGYRGNPYLDGDGGCTDIDECKEREKYICYGNCTNVEGSYHCTCLGGSSSEDPKQKPCISDSKRSTVLLGIIIGISGGMGLLLICIAIFILRRNVRKRRQEKMKEKYFHQNHGLLLKQLISSNENVTERTKIFSLKEIEKATDNFDQTRVIGHGGHGTVYKGILSDQRVVAIKKSKIVKKSEIDQFINEVVILSQIKHRHVVKLFGCCLESEVPLLIYEFISNGALSDHLHVTSGNSILSWDDRLRIVTEAAGAIAYLHSAASISILHRDIKSSNILLDDHFTTKVSDFGASRFIPLDQTHVITAVQGTFGYLDPEYYQTSQLTEKSDVYSFGIILLEILTGKKPIYATEDEENLNLPMSFLQATRENQSFDLVEDCVRKESNEEELNEIFRLIRICIKLKGVDRPTMKEVEYDLQNLRKMRMKKKGSYIPEDDEEAECLLRSSLYAYSDGTSRNYSSGEVVQWSQYCPR